jgi:N-acetylglucosamine kinase-like BadF-type ATPase
MGWLIGIDGGGTKTVACAADLSGRLLGRVEKGAANYHVVGLPAFAALVAGLVADLAAAAGRDPADLALVSLGLAGADRDRDRRLLEEALAGLKLGCPCLIESDARIALAAGLGDRGEGIVLIAGTGSIAYGRTRGGEVRAGGWGHLVSDEGSGYDIGRRAIARGLKANEGRDIPSDLLARIVARLGVGDLAGLIAFIYSPATAKADIAALAETVHAAADDGDKLAAAILDEAVGDLSGLVESVLARAFPSPGPVPVALYGGLLLGSPGLRSRLADRLAGRAELLPPGPEPVMGALKIGYDYLKSI